MELIQENVSALASKLGSTPEVITKFLTDAQAAAEVKPFADTLGLLEVFKPEELSLRITNERTAAATEASNTAKGNTYGAMDKRILTETGIAKNEGESTIDYMARAAKEKFGKPGNESEEMQRLRDDLKAKDQLLTQKTTELDQLNVKYATDAKQLQINSKLDAAINKLPINVEDKYLDGQRELLKFKLGQKYDIDVVEGKVQFTDKLTKEVVRDAKLAAPMSEADLIAQFAPTVVSLKQDTSAKLGSGYQGSGNDFNSGDANFDFSKYTSLKEFTDDLAKQGIAAGSAKAGELYTELKKQRADLK